MKTIKRPKVSARKSAMDANSTIIEVTAPDGSGLLIEVRAQRDGTGLRVYPYRACGDISLHVSDRGSHDAQCRLYNDRSGESRCDCGAELVPNREETGLAVGWRRTEKSQP